MNSHYDRKMFDHGGSKAVNLPKDLVRLVGGESIHFEIREDGAFIPFENSMDMMESDPLFESFIQAIYKNALENPDQLKDLSEVWDQEWDELLEGVDGGDEE